MDGAESEVKPRRTVEEETLLARAKEKLMEEKGLTEAQAHRYLQKQSMDHGVRMAGMARQVLENVLWPGNDA